MPITTIQANTPDIRPTASTKPYRGDQSFAALLDHQGLAAKTGQTQAISSADEFSPQQATIQQTQVLIPLGKINAASPTVSHLLHNHPDLRHERGEIIFAAVNREKPFTTMREGTAVAMDARTHELVFAAPSSPPQPPADNTHSATMAGDGKIILGAISPDTPTTSHLLSRDPRFSKESWNILFSPVNQEKPYTSLPPGTVVTINPQTLELSFHSPDLAGSNAPPPIATAIPAQPEVSAAPDPEQISFAGRLAKSVRSYLGQPYHTLDCYGLVVHGLKDQGVRYGGADGLRQQLEQLAKEQGLPPNAFHNGEGLIEIAGQKVYDHSIVRVTNAAQQTREVLNQLEPLLQEGMLLSFSTPSRGHTGVIGKQDGQWTYVNSGMIDHQVNGGKVSRRVGEETLAEEIKNWCLLAKHQATSLKVSAGLFDTRKLKTLANLPALQRADGQAWGVKGDGDG